MTDLTNLTEHFTSKSGKKPLTQIKTTPISSIFLEVYEDQSDH